ncbi:alpha/beta fold hydrolase [Planotetraspora sp. GP83]|uniref:alpha/beta fold hydrolase n=1 Tax=Planotetraspora sp. GP83 TaxID=3156264 RepID=UPI00351305B9
MTRNTLKVPGATLYYEVRGSGPVLLMIPGGPTDASVFAGLSDALADRYTTVAYDPRGNSRSVLDGPPEDQRLDVHGDDAHHLLAAVTSEPAYVLGSSGGAQIGLDLAARHPERVRTLVAHEPPAVELLPDAARHRALMREVYDTYRKEGVGPAMRKFEEGIGMGGEDDEVPPPMDPGAEMPEDMARIIANLEFFIAHGARPLSGYVPDVAALRSGSTRVVVGVGEASAGQLAHRTALALAERLGTDPVTFPGDHAGYGSHPAAFAETLHKVLSGG